MGAFKNLMIGDVQVKNFNELEAELKRLNDSAIEKREKLLNEAFELMNARLNKNKTLNEYIEKLESSRELTVDESDGWPMRWTHFDSSQFIDIKSELEREALTRFLSESFFVYIDFKNDIIISNDGPCILINEDGDVLDQNSGKWIIDKSEYVDDNGEEIPFKRNELIEEWMEKSGYFPSVVSQDRYGNMFYVSTKETEK